MAVVTVSRELGSWGQGIGASVARRLGYEFVDRRLVTDIAQTTGSTPEEVERFDEKGEGRIRFFLKRLLVPQLNPGAFAKGGPAGGYLPEFGPEFPYLPDHGRPQAGWTLDRGTYQLLVTTLVQDAGATGNAVIMGRASQIILTALPGTVHVKITAPVGLRVERLMRARQLPREAAARLVEQHDRWRQQYLLNYYGVHWDDPLLYDVVLNTARTTEEEAATVVAELATLRHGRSAARAPDRELDS